MKEYIRRGCLGHMTDLGGFDELRNEVLEEGFVRNVVKVTDEAANFFKTAHGGFLMTVCDTTACMAVYSLGLANMTMQCAFNFIDAPEVGKTVYVEATVVGRAGPHVTAEVQVVDEIGWLYTTARFVLHVDHEVQPDETFPPRRML